MARAHGVDDMQTCASSTRRLRTSFPQSRSLLALRAALRPGEAAVAAPSSLSGVGWWVLTVRRVERVSRRLRRVTARAAGDVDHHELGRLGIQSGRADASGSIITPTAESRLCGVSRPAWQPSSCRRETFRRSSSKGVWRRTPRRRCPGDGVSGDGDDCGNLLRAARSGHRVRRARDELEQTIAECRIPARPAASGSRQFFELVGHSLLAIRLTARLPRLLVEVPSACVMDGPTIAQLAVAVRATTPATEDPAISRRWSRSSNSPSRRCSGCSRRRRNGGAPGRYGGDEGGERSAVPWNASSAASSSRGDQCHEHHGGRAPVTARRLEADVQDHQLHEPARVHQRAEHKESRHGIRWRAATAVPPSFPTMATRSRARRFRRPRGRTRAGGWSAGR